MNKCMLCAYPLQEGEEWNQDENDWFKNGKKIQWNAWNEFAYPEESFSAPMKGAQPPRKSQDADRIYLTKKHTKAIRKALKDKFPDMKFRVRKLGHDSLQFLGYTNSNITDPKRIEIDNTILEVIRNIENDLWGREEGDAPPPLKLTIYDEDYYPRFYRDAESFSAEKTTQVYGTGKYRFNQYGVEGHPHTQYRFKTKDDAIRWLCFTPHRVYWVKPGQECYDVVKYSAESFEDFKRKMVGDDTVAGDLGYMEALEEFYEDYLGDFERITDEFCPEPETFEEFQERVLKNDYEMSLEAEDWGGNPKGKLACALQKAREKAKKPQKPLKIEKLDADSGWNMPPGVFSIPEPEHRGDYDLRHEYDYENYLDLELWKEAGLTEPEEYEEFYERKEEEAKRIAEEEAKEKMERDKEDARNLGYACMYDEYPHEWEEAHHIKGGGFQCNACGEWRQTIEDAVMEKRHDHAYSAESFSAPTKGIDTFTKPFEESSLDSGTIKSIVAGLGIGALALFGYNKWK